MAQKKIFEIIVREFPLAFDQSFVQGNAMAVGLLLDDISEALSSGLNAEKIEADLNFVFGEKAFKKRLKRVVSASGRFENVRELKTYSKALRDELVPLNDFVIQNFKNHVKKSYSTLGMLGVLQLLSAINPSDISGAVTNVSQHVAELQRNLDALFA